MALCEPDHVTIAAESLCFDASGRGILSDITIHSSARRIGVVGRNGSGKSTLARLVAGLLRPSGGSLRVAGHDMFRDRKAALRTVGVMFQNPEHQIIFPTVREEMAFGLRQMGQGKADAAATVLQVLERFDKSHWIDAVVDQLSHGQKHLLCMMSVLAMRPRLLILDEPFAGLDIPTRLQLRRHLALTDVAVLHVTHDPDDLQGYDEVFWLDQGRLRAVGPADTMLSEFAADMRRQGTADDLSSLAG